MSEQERAELIELLTTLMNSYGCDENMSEEEYNETYEKYVRVERSLNVLRGDK